ncbi:MAG: hypothetical protein ACI8RZ_007735 [Myxococcota bacterium]|jgi:hypothetical protein
MTITNFQLRARLYLGIAALAGVDLIQFIGA